MNSTTSSKVAGTKFAQQSLGSYRFLLTSRAGFTIFTLFAIVFFAIGVAQTLTVSGLQVFEVRYDNECGTEANCSVDLAVGSDLVGPLVLYYRLTNFYQNHRRYVTSRAADQLRGDYVSGAALDTCDPIRDNGTGALLVPCGLAAVSFFNDSFDVTPSLPLNDSEIAWAADRRSLFGSPNKRYEEEGADFWLNQSGVEGGQTNEHFIVWMRLAALSNIVKVYKRCDNCTVAAGNYTVQIANKYPVDSFNGEKWVGIREEHIFGARNKFFEILCWVLGAVWFTVDIALIILHVAKPRQPGDRTLIRILIAQAETQSMAPGRDRRREVSL
jgi:hypothetical protein